MPRAPSLLPKKGQGSTPSGTPLAPSVEKAYYRKCIQLKRRLNEVEAANEETNIRRSRLDRAIMKMRLERAFLLEQMGKRVGIDVEGSEGSGGEGPGTPPPDRPHRDKRRRVTHRGQPTVGASAPLPHTSQQPLSGPSQATRAPVYQMPVDAEPPMVPGPDGQLVRANGVGPDSQHVQAEYQPGDTNNARPDSHGKEQGASGEAAEISSRMSLDGAGDEREVDRQAAVTGEPVGAAPEVREINGERRVVPGNTAAAAAAAPGSEAEGGAGFTAVNQAP